MISLSTFGAISFASSIKLSLLSSIFISAFLLVSYNLLASNSVLLFSASTISSANLSIDLSISKLASLLGSVFSISSFKSIFSLSSSALLSFSLCKTGISGIAYSLSDLLTEPSLIFLR